MRSRVLCALGDEGAADAKESGGTRQLIELAQVHADRRKNRDMQDGMEVVGEGLRLNGFDGDAAVAEVETRAVVCGSPLNCA